MTLGIFVRDPDAYIRQAPFLARWLVMKPNAKTRGTPLMVGIFMLNIERESLLDHVERLAGVEVQGRNDDAPVSA